MNKKKMFSAASSAGNGLVDIHNPGSCVEARQRPLEGGRKSKMSKRMIILAAVAGLVLALAPAAQAAITNDFSTDPNIASDWVIHAFDGGINNPATWNSGDQDLDLSSGGTGFCALRQSGALRGPTDTVSLDIKAANFGSNFLGRVGLMISSSPTPTIADNNPRYTFWLRGRADNRDWRVYKDSHSWLYTVYANVRSAFAYPATLSIERNGANYDFKIDGNTVWTGNSYTSAQHDSMVYYHILWGADATALAMTATVDNFAPIPIPEPATLALVALGGLGLIVRRRRS